jgi:hypothetical protein
MQEALPCCPKLPRRMLDLPEDASKVFVKQEPHGSISVQERQSKGRPAQESGSATWPGFPGAARGLLRPNSNAWASSPFLLDQLGDQLKPSASAKRWTADPWASMPSPDPRRRSGETR